MCLRRKKKKKEASPEFKEHWLKVCGTSLRSRGETDEQFLELREHLSLKLGVHVTKTQVLRHAIALAHQHYQQKIGVGSYINAKA